MACSLGDEFVEAVRLGKHREAGWPESMYGVSNEIVALHVHPDRGGVSVITIHHGQRLLSRVSK